ncbi:hypothetical protein ECE50_028935 [Chitinophaga sp. Mgbs1]|uniref:Uncharacterized protein n=1 Tax=Chitinophaga solisilvae TaxID=1233460 RepID=A0A3S1D2Z5_9BACT|nr:hypothetical protein [Chitinophaga solisilvae]
MMKANVIMVAVMLSSGAAFAQTVTIKGEQQVQVKGNVNTAAAGRTGQAGVSGQGQVQGSAALGGSVSGGEMAAGVQQLTTTQAAAGQAAVTTVQTVAVQQEHTAITAATTATKAVTTRVEAGQETIIAVKPAAAPVAKVALETSASTRIQAAVPVKVIHREAMQVTGASAGIPATINAGIQPAIRVKPISAGVRTHIRSNAALRL